jgi:MOSC domain-containing protein YiiM
VHGNVIAVCCDNAHRFSKPIRLVIRLVAGHGVEGDTHSGAFVQHRYLARRNPDVPNIRQVHLIPSELLARLTGIQLTPGDLGENITTAGIDLHALPQGALLRLGDSAEVELTGLRTPCGYIDRFHKGLKRQMIVKADGHASYTAGVLGIVRTSGDVAAGDRITVTLPKHPWKPLPAI